MNTVERQRTKAVRTLMRLGYTFVAGEWTHPANDAVALIDAADMLHALLVKRACEITETHARPRQGQEEDYELAAIFEAIETYRKTRDGQTQACHRLQSTSSGS